MKDQCPYFERAEEILQFLNTQEMLSAGLIREKQKYDFIVQYPPSLTLRPMDGSEIYT
jgi:hypothetical protein